MIVYEGGPGAAVRAGELVVGGRRVAARATAYSGDAESRPDRFDPVELRFVSGPVRGTVLAGPASPRAWAEAFFRMPAGPVLVAGAAPGEPVQGAYRAAAEGVRRAGRAAYLLDPPPEGLPLPDERPARSGMRRGSVDRGAPFVALFAWSPVGGADLPGLSASVARGIPSGVAWPVIPGWTAEAAFVSPWLARAAAAGAGFAAPLPPSVDGEFRRAAVAARSETDPPAGDALFEVLHHTEWPERIGADIARARRFVREAGLAIIAPRPRGPGEPAANHAAAALLEERALEAPDDHRAALLHAAVRWIDACGRDLAAIVREGNFARAFPFDRDLARETEDAVRGGGR